MFWKRGAKAITHNGVVRILLEISNILGFFVPKGVKDVWAGWNYWSFLTSN